MKMAVRQNRVIINAEVEEIYVMYYALEYFSSLYKGEYEWAVPIARDMANVIYSEDEEE